VPAIGIDVGAVRARLNPRRVSGARRDGVFLPHGPGAGQSLENALREAQARRHTQFSTEHLALGLLAVDEGLVPAILSALGVSAPALRAAILDRSRQAG
jgi:carbamoylphosphate synthase small subunit